MSRTALLTGISGFIGGRLAVRLLQDGWHVHAVIRPSTDTSAVPPGVGLHQYDGSGASLRKVLETSRPDVVFHLASLYLAAHQPEDIDGLVASNILFPAQLAEAMIGAGVTRMINTGTAWQHFEGREYDPVNLYAATKQAGSDLLRFFQNARGLSVVTLKLFDTFGDGDKRRKLAQLLLDAAASGEKLLLSPGRQVLDLTHVDDVAEAFLLAAARLLDAKVPVAEEFLLPGERMDIVGLVELLRQVTTRSINAEFGARPYRDREVMRPPEPGLRPVLPGWVPSRSFRSWAEQRLVKMEAQA